VAFDPDAWLKANTGGAAPAAPTTPAPAAAAGGFDPDAWLKKNSAPGPYRDGFVAPTASVPQLPPLDQLPENRTEPVSTTEAVIRGAGRGIFGGFAAQVAGGVGAYGASPHFNITSLTDASNRNRAAGDPTGARTMKEIATDYEKRDEQVREEKPVAFIAGQVLAPGARTLKGAVGHAAALGATESKGDTALEVVTDAAGAGAGAYAGGKLIQGGGKALGWVGKKVFGEAAERVEKRATDKLLEGTPAKTVQDPAIAALGGKENIPKVLKEEGLEKALYGPAKKLDAELDKRLDEVGGKLGAYYQRVDEAAPGVPPEYIRDKLMALAQNHRSDPDTADAIRSYANRLAAEYTHDGAVSAQELHKVVQALGRRGYGTNPANPSMGAQLKRDIRTEVLGVLQQHVDDVTRETKGIGNLKELQALNQKYRRLVNIEHVAEAKAARDERYSPTLGQRAQQVARYGISAAGAAGAAQQLMEGNASVAAVGALATGAALAAPAIARAADKLAANINDARLVNVLKTSPNVTEFLARTARIGIPRQLALESLGLPREQLQKLLGQPAEPVPTAEPAAPYLSGN